MLYSFPIFLSIGATLPFSETLLLDTISWQRAFEHVIICDDDDDDNKRKKEEEAGEEEEWGGGSEGVERRR